MAFSQACALAACLLAPAPASLPALALALPEAAGLARNILTPASQCVLHVFNRAVARAYRREALPEPNRFNQLTINE